MTKTADPFGTPKDSDDGFELDLTGATGSSFRIPAGDYTARCVDIQQGVSKAGNPMFTWTFALTSGQHAGKEFKLWTALTPAALFKVVETLEAFGIEAAGKMVKLKREQVVGKQVVLQIVDDTYEDKESSSIKKVKPHPDGPVPPKAGDPLATPGKRVPKA